MSSPIVSVIIPTYNREALLPRAIDSVVAQSFDDWELLLVDDGSTDATPRLAETYARRLEHRFHYIPQENLGAAAARNKGIDASRGEFVAFLDSDDEFLPSKLQRQFDLFALRPSLGFVYSDFAFIDLQGRREASAFRSKFPLALEVAAEPLGSAMYACGSNLFDTLIRGYFVATIVGMVRREVLGETIRFAEDQSYAEEWLFYLRVSRQCEAGFVDAPLSLHHFTASSLAREDKHRNTLRMHGLLRTIAATFPDMRRDHHDAIRMRLAESCRQLAFDATAAGRHREAVRWGLEELQHVPGRRAMADIAGASARLLAKSLRLTPRPSHRDSPCVPHA